MAGVDNSGRYNSVAGNASINYPFDTYCANGSDVKPVIRGGSGGTFSATPNGLVIDSTTGVLDVSASTPDTEYTISYTVPGFNVATDVVTILPASDSSFSYPNNVNIRSGYLIPTITGATGGTFSGSKGLYVDPNTGIIDLARTSVDFTSFTVTYITGVNCPSFTSVDLVIMNPFIIRVTIPASGSTSPYVLKPQTSSGSCTVNWGDSNTETITGDTTHSFPISSSDVTYDISIYDASGSKFEGFNAAWDTGTITNYENSIIQWGDVQWKNNSWFLTGLPNGALPKLRLSAPNGASHKPDLSQVTSLYQLFYNKSKSRNLIWEDVNNNLANWDTSTITNMAQAFVLHGSPGSRPSDSQPNIMQLSNWDTSNVTDMNNMFLGAAVTANGVYTSNIGVDATNWNTQNVQSFSSTFRCKGTLTGIENLRTESCTNMSSMFYYRALPGNVDTKYVNGILRWDVSKVASFSSFAYKSAGTSGSLFPSKWKLSGDGQDIDMSNAFWGFDFDLNDSPDLCATKTVNETWYGGTSYTAWDMSNTTSISSMFRGAGANAAQTPPPNGYNPNISTWQMSSKFTTMQYFARADGSQVKGLLGIDQDLGHWNVTNISSPNGLLEIIGFRTANERPSFSTANYDSILSITDGWGSQAANVNSGVNMDFGFSKYSPGNALAVSRGNVTNPVGIPSGQMFVYDSTVVIKDLTSVGDIVQLMNGGASYGEFAKITGYLATDDRVAFVDVLGGANFPVNWPGLTWQYQIYDSDAAKGRYALLDAGWTITDGGVDIPFESAEIEIELAPGQETMTVFTHGINAKIDWGDGNGFINNPSTGQPYTHYYAAFTYPTVAAGTTDIYRIKIRENETESFSGFAVGRGYPYGGIYGGGLRIRKIIAWGSHKAQTYSQAFQQADLNKAGFTNTLPVDANGKVTKPTWITSITSFSQAFQQSNLPANVDFSNWASGLAATNVSTMFSGNTNFIGTGLTNWNLTKVTNMASFVSGTAFNSDISGWDLQSCTNAGSLFSGTPFNHPSISNLNLYNITTITSMFQGCTAFNQDVDTKVVGTGADAYLAWDTSNVNDMHACFNGATSFNYSIGKWKIDLTSLRGLASFFAYVGNNVTGGYTHDLLTKDVTVGAGTPVAKTYVAWDVSSVNGFGSSTTNYPTSMGTFFNGKFNGDITNWDMSGLGQIGNPQYGYAGEWSKMFYLNSLFNQDISRKTITNVSGKGTYTAWGMSDWIGGIYSLYLATAFDQNIGNWALNTSDTSSRSMSRFFRDSGMSTANYTDTFVGWANTVKANGGFPKNKAFADQTGMTFDSNRSGGANFANAWEARSYLTNTVANGGAGWSISSDTILPLLVPSTSSLSFNGSTEYIDVQASPRALVGNSNAYTISAYVFIEEADIAEENYFIIGAMSGAERWYFRVDDGYVGFAYGSIISSTTSTAITAGQWNHVAVTYNGTNTHKIYVDGGNPKYTSTSSTGQTITTNDAYIGALNNGTDSLHFKGKIDEVMVWNTELAQANIQTLANAVGSGNVVNPEQLSTGLQLWNRMGD